MFAAASHRTKAHSLLRFLAFAALGLALAGPAWADQHPTGVPVLNSRPDAPYTIYLDFSGFDFSGDWGGSGKAPGDQPAYDGVASTGSFNSARRSLAASSPNAKRRIRFI